MLLIWNLVSNGKIMLKCMQSFGCCPAVLSLLGDTSVETLGGRGPTGKPSATIGHCSPRTYLFLLLLTISLHVPLPSSAAPPSLPEALPCLSLPIPWASGTPPPWLCLCTWQFTKQRWDSTSLTSGTKHAAYAFPIETTYMWWWDL